MSVQGLPPEFFEYDGRSEKQYNKDRFDEGINWDLVRFPVRKPDEASFLDEIEPEDAS